MFPLPIPFSDVGGLRKSAGVSRSVQRRIKSSLAWRSWANDGTRALNHLAHSDTVSFNAPSGAQTNAVHSLSECYRLAGKPPSDFSAAGAFHELCSKSLPYISDGNGPSPYEKGNVSLPARVDEILSVDTFARARDCKPLMRSLSNMLCSDS